MTWVTATVSDVALREQRSVAQGGGPVAERHVADGLTERGRQGGVAQDIGAVAVGPAQGLRDAAIEAVQARTPVLRIAPAAALDPDTRRLEVAGGDDPDRPGGEGQVPGPRLVEARCWVAFLGRREEAPQGRARGESKKAGLLVASLLGLEGRSEDRQRRGKGQHDREPEPHPPETSITPEVRGGDIGLAHPAYSTTGLKIYCARSMTPRRLCLSLPLGIALLHGACGKGATERAPFGVLVVSDGRHSSAFTRNFNPLNADSLWPTRAGVYESLLVFNSIKGTYVPWLASEFRWSEANTRLTFSLRPGIKWSDGQPLTARDVAFSFDLVRRHPALDSRSIWGFLSDVLAKDDLTVEFAFKRAYTPGLVYIGHHPIVPEHAWKDVADPGSFRNENPVASGPFTTVATFTPQMYEIRRNEAYWHAGKPKALAVRVLAFADNETATRALVEGRLDWAGLFVADVDSAFVARDRAHNHYWFPPWGTRCSCT